MTAVRPMRHILRRAALASVLAGLFAAPAQACQSDLTGRVLDAAAVRSFGAVQGLPPLPLEAGEYVITIDDGPLPATTPALAAILKQACVRATFFFVGRRLNAHPELARAVREDGDAVGSHSSTHPDFGKLDPAGRMDELGQGVEAVERALDTPLGDGSPRYVRLPGAAGFPPKAPEDLVQSVEAKGWIVAGYDISPEDWRNSPPEESFARLEKRLGDRGVIVFHDGQANTLRLLPMVLAELSRRGAKVVSLP